MAKAKRPDSQSRQYWASLPIYFLPDHVIPRRWFTWETRLIISHPSLPLVFILSPLQLLAEFPCYLPVESSSQESRRSPFTGLENGSLGKSGAFPISGPEPPSSFPNGLKGTV